MKGRFAFAFVSLSAWAMSAFGAGTASFDATTSLLTMPSVKLQDGPTYSNVVIKLRNFGALALGDQQVGTDILYLPTTNVIQLPAVTLDGSFYYKVSLTNPTFDLVSVGAEAVTPSGLGSLAITGNAVGTLGRTNPPTFTPERYDNFVWALGSGTTLWQVSLAMNVLTSGSSIGAWQAQQGILGGLSAIGVTLDMPKGLVQFKDSTLSPQGPYSGSVIINGTFNIPPAVGTSVTITGTGIPEAGSGFDADAPAKPTAFQIGSATRTDYSWKARGITLAVSSYTTGDVVASLTNAAGPGWQTTSAKNTVKVDAAKKTVTFTNLVIPGKSPTKTSITLNGTLGYE